LNLVRSKTCMPWLAASLTTKAKLLYTFTSLQELDTVAVGNIPTNTGFSASEISIKDVFALVPIKAYSFPVSGSVHPQQSLPSDAFISERGTLEIRSIPSQG